MWSLGWEFAIKRFAFKTQPTQCFVFVDLGASCASEKAQHKDGFYETWLVCSFSKMQTFLD